MGSIPGEILWGGGHCGGGGGGGSWLKLQGKRVREGGEWVEEEEKRAVAVSFWEEKDEPIERGEKKTGAQRVGHKLRLEQGGGGVGANAGQRESGKKTLEAG